MKENKFKMTEVGLVPEDWEVKKLGDMGCLLKGSINPQMFPNKNFCEYSMPAFDDGKIPQIKEGLAMQSNRICIKAPVLLFNKLNVRQKRIWYVNKCLNDAVCSTEFLPYISDNIELNYLRYFVETDKVTNDFIGMSRGSSNSQKRIAPIDFLSYIIALPPLPEQQKIAKALSDVDTLISSLDALIAKKRDIKKGTMQQLLTGKKRLPGFTEPWVEKKLGEALQYEQPTSYIVHDTEYIEHGIPVLTAGKSFILGYTAEKEGVYNKGNVIIFDDFTTDSKYVTFPFKAKSSAMKMLTAKDGYNLRFTYELLSTIDYKPFDHMRHWIGMFSNIILKFPPLPEQTAIASILSSMDDEISALEAKRDKYISIKQGMMQELLTGKTRLV